MARGKREWHQLLRLQPTNLEGYYSWPAPSEKFNPLLASQKELQRCGLPSRPDPKESPTRHKMWHDLYGRAFKYIVPELSILERKRGPLIGSPEEAQGGSFPNWAGSVYFADPGQTFTQISGTWTVPGVGQPAAGPYFEAGDWSSVVWVGIDGAFISGDVFQAGTEQDLSGAALGGSGLFGDSSATSYFAWTEWYPANPVQVNNFQVSPGDSMGVVLQITNLNDQFNLWGIQFDFPIGQATILNLTQGNFTTVAMTGPLYTVPGIGVSNPAAFQGYTAEWVTSVPEEPRTIFPSLSKATACAKATTPRYGRGVNTACGVPHWDIHGVSTIRAARSTDLLLLAIATQVSLLPQKSRNMHDESGIFGQLRPPR